MRHLSTYAFGVVLLMSISSMSSAESTENQTKAALIALQASTSEARTQVKAVLEKATVKSIAAKKTLAQAKSEASKSATKHAAAVREAMDDLQQVLSLQLTDAIATAEDELNNVQQESEKATAIYAAAEKQAQESWQAADQSAKKARSALQLINEQQEKIQALIETL